MGKRLLAWDAPNMDQVLASLVGGRPTPQQRPDFAKLLDWCRERGAGSDDFEAAVFVNVAPETAVRLAGWVAWLQATGYRVFTRPKVDGAGDIDPDMKAYITGVPPHDLDEVLIGSHDARAFLEIAEELSKAGVAVTVLGFRELAGGLALNEALEFVDLEDIPGLLAEPPPRVSLAHLPPEGWWWEPLPRDLPRGFHANDRED